MIKPDTLLDIRQVSKQFTLQKSIFLKNRSFVHAVDHVSLTLPRGETLGLVGESGCGKSTLARIVLRLINPTGGSVFLNGVNITALSGKALLPHRRRMQMIFQDPYASLNPRMTAQKIVAEPLVNFNLGQGEEIIEKVTALFQKVGLRKDQLNSLPHEFSGGQRQRLGIARALATEPELIVADEPVSALDVSVQAQVINVLLKLQQELGLTYMFVSHDLSVVEHVSHRVAVMYLGQIVESADNHSLFHNPKHPYTQALIAAVPNTNPRRRGLRQILGGDVPSPINPPSGCRFHTRCPHVTSRCRVEAPVLTENRLQHAVACHLIKNDSIK